MMKLMKFGGVEEGDIRVDENILASGKARSVKWFALKTRLLEGLSVFENAGCDPMGLQNLRQSLDSGIIKDALFL